MFRNPYKALRDLLPEPTLVVGEVVAYSNGTATVELPGGGKIKAVGEAAVEDIVFVRGGAIEGPAPSLAIEIIEV